MDRLEDTFGGSRGGVTAARRGPVGEVLTGGIARVGGLVRRRPPSLVLEGALIVSKRASVAEQEFGHVQPRVSDVGFCFFQMESSGARNSAVDFSQSWGRKGVDIS